MCSSAQATPSSPAHRRRWPRVLAYLLIAVLVLAVLAQLVAAPIAERVINRKLAQLDGFVGEVGDVNIELWRGAAELHDVVLRERDYPNDPPFAKIDKISFSGAAEPLLRGQLGGEAVVEGAAFTLIKRERFAGLDDALDEAKDELEDHQAKINRWQKAVEDAFPLELDRFEMKNASVRFVDHGHHPAVDVGIDPLNVVVTHLRNRPDKPGPPMELTLDGKATGGGDLHWYLKAEPLAKPLKFQTTFELKDLALPPINSFLLAYTNTDVSSGTFDLYVEIEAKEGRYDGSVKPFLKDLEFETASDAKKGFVQNLKENVVDAVTSILENDETEKVATRTPLSGTFKENQVDLWATVTNLLRNAFVQALREGFGTSPAG